MDPTPVTGRSASGYFLRDRFSHQLLKSVPASQLVRFYENHTHRTNSKSTKFETESNGSGSEMTDDSTDDMVFTLTSNGKGQSCQRASLQNLHKTSTPKKSQDTISSQIIIVSSKELPMSSDESSTIDVSTDLSTPKSPSSPITNPWGDMDIDDIPIQLVDDLIFSGDEESSEGLQIIKNSKAPPIVYNPLTTDERRVAAHKFNLVINGGSHPVKYSGVGNQCPCPPMITKSARGDGACLFNSFSMLLSGRETYSAIIRHVLCNYISNPIKHKWLQSYLPSPFKNGKEYILKTNMRNFSTWGTEVEIVAFAQLSGFDIYVYTEHNWLRYSHCIDNGEDEKSERAFYISNESGNHFDPVFDA